MGPPADTRSFARKRSMRGVVFALFFFLLGCPGGDPRPPAPKSVHGVLDLQNWDLQKDGPVSLSGAWEFYWRHHYGAADFARGDQAAAALIQVPKAWNDQKVDGRKISGEGYATYRLKVLLGDGSGLLALKFLDMAVAFSVEVNGSAIAAVDLLRATLPANIAVQSFADQHLPLVQSNPTQIHQVIMNLCTNSQHAMEESGGVLSVGLTRFSLTRDQSREFPDLTPGLYLRLDVRDTGDGIDPGIMDRIYDPFFTTKGSGKGSGMGLSVVHGIVKSHAGSIHIRSTPGAGTIVQVLLPAVDIEVKAEGRTVETVSMGNERILLVDDEEPLAQLGKQALERLGYDVTALTNPIAALEAFRKSPERYDLVVTDRTMPVLSGFHLAAELKRIRPAIPIILCTGFVQAADEQQAASTGISRIILKPLEIGELARAIRQSLVAGGDSDPAIKAAR
jgi:CheY-like chemotaxis protein